MAAAMYITKNTDYSFRTLMLLAVQPSEQLTSIEQISASLQVSRAHLMKVVNRLATLALLETVRGRHGGVRLMSDASDINIGTVFRQLEEIDKIIDCDDGPCVFQGACKLDKIFRDASEAFMAELDQYTLADLVRRKSQLLKVLNFQRGG